MLVGIQYWDFLPVFQRMPAAVWNPGIEPVCFKWQVKRQIWPPKKLLKGTWLLLGMNPDVSCLPKGSTTMSMDHADSSACRRDVNTGEGWWSGRNWELRQTKFDWEKLDLHRFSRFWWSFLLLRTFLDIIPPALPFSFWFGNKAFKKIQWWGKHTVLITKSEDIYEHLLV